MSASTARGRPRFVKDGGIWKPQIYNDNSKNEENSNDKDNNKYNDNNRSANNNAIKDMIMILTMK